MVCKDIAAAVQAIHEPPQQVMQTPSADHDFDSIWDVSAEINTDPVSDSVLYSTVLSTAVISKSPADDQQTSIVEVPDVSCQSTFPPLTSSTPTSTRPASTRPAPTPATPRPTPTSTRPAPTPATPRLAPASTRPTPSPAWGKENVYSKSNLKYKFSSDGTHYVQGKDDPLSNMWPVELSWDKHTFSSSEHVYVYEMLKWHGKLNYNTLQILLNSTVFRQRN